MHTKFELNRQLIRSRGPNNSFNFFLTELKFAHDKHHLPNLQEHFLHTNQHDCLIVNKRDVAFGVYPSRSSSRTFTAFLAHVFLAFLSLSFQLYGPEHVHLIRCASLCIFMLLGKPLYVFVVT